MESSRWLVLAGARFILAWIVMTAHLFYLDLSKKTAWTHVGAYLNASSAVYGFLIISGYSIAASIESSEKGFYARRFWRIFPVYYTSLLLAIAVSIFIPNGFISVGGFGFRPATGLGLLAALFMLQSFVVSTISVDGQLWTIAVEWWNYMLAPLFAKLASAVLMVPIALSLGAYVLWHPPGDPSLTTHGQMFATLSWFWLIGFIYYRYKRTALGFAILIAPILVSASYADFGRAGIISLLAVVLSDDLKISKRYAKIVEWAGELSYPLYAIHIPVFIFFLRFNLSYPFGAGAAAIVLSIIILHVIDSPLRGWGRRLAGLYRSRSESIPESAVP